MSLLQITVMACPSSITQLSLFSYCIRALSPSWWRDTGFCFFLNQCTPALRGCSFFLFFHPGSAPHVSEWGLQEVLRLECPCFTQLPIFPPPHSSVPFSARARAMSSGATRVVSVPSFPHPSSAPMSHEVCKQAHMGVCVDQLISLMSSGSETFQT